MLSLRFLSPALIDISPLSCKTVTGTASRAFHSSASRKSKDNQNYEISPVFENRNPRCLEVMGLAPKKKGWKFQSPKRDYYLKIDLTLGKEHTTASLVHWNGNTVITASTREPFIAKALYSPSDVSAAWNVGRLLARRLLESGLTNVFFDVNQLPASSEKCEVFLKALEEANITFEEPEEVVDEFIPGINYDGYNRYNEPRKYQDDYQKL